MTIPWMPFYVDDYVGDTLHLTTLEHGAYLLLIMHYWRKGCLPQDDDSLAAITRLSGKDWQRIRSKLMGFFEDGWKHRRIDLELQKASEKSERRAEAGARGGKAKSLKTKDASVANATDLLEQKPAVALASSPESTKQKDSLNLATIELEPAMAAAQPAAEPRVSRETIPEVSNKFDRMQAMCCHALGEKAPCDLNISPMMQLLAKGYPESVIMDALAAAARVKRHKPVRTWSLWATIIEPDLDRFVVQPPKEAAKPVAKVLMFSVKGLSGGERKFTADQLREQVAQWHRNGAWDSETYGYPPSHRFCDLPWSLFMTREQEASWVEDNIWPVVTPRYLTEQAGEANTA